MFFNSEVCVCACPIISTTGFNQAVSYVRMGFVCRWLVVCPGPSWKGTAAASRVDFDSSWYWGNCCNAHALFLFMLYNLGERRQIHQYTQRSWGPSQFTFCATLGQHHGQATFLFNPCVSRWTSESWIQTVPTPTLKLKYKTSSQNFSSKLFNIFLRK